MQRSIGKSLEDAVLETVKSVSSFFGIPPPVVEFADIDQPGLYVDGRIIISRRLTPEQAVAVAAHECAHYSHDFYGIPCRTDECEAYASMFERIWLRMGSRSTRFYSPCVRCGYPVLAYRSRCLRCDSVYDPPQVWLIATLSSAALLLLS